MKYSLSIVVFAVFVSFLTSCDERKRASVTKSDGAIALRDGRFDEAVKLLAAAAEDRPEDGTAFYLLGVANCQLRRWDAAAEAFKSASTIMTDDSRSLQFYAECLGQLGRWNESIEVLVKARELAPKSVSITTALGVAKLKTGDTQGAQSEFLEALRIDSGYEAALYNIAFLNHKWLKKDAVAQKYFHDYLEAGGDPVHEQQVNRALQDIEDRAAREAAKQARAVAAKRAEVAARKQAEEERARVRAAAIAATPGEAIAEPPRVEKKPQRNVAIRETRAGLDLCRAKQWRRAAERFRRAIAADASYDVAYHNLGLAYNEAGDRDAAIAAFRETLKLKPRKTPARYALALVLWKKRDTAEAIAELNALLKIDPGYARAHFLMGTIYEKLATNMGKVRDHFETYLRLEPSGQRASYASKWLERNTITSPASAPVDL